MLRKVRLNRVFTDTQPDKDKTIIDTTLFGVALALMAVGLIMVSSASMDISSSIFGNPFLILIKQVVFMGVGLVGMLSMLSMPIERLDKWSWLALLVAIVLLICVLLFGRTVNGSTRWIHFGFFNLQASELAKMLIVIYLASYLKRQLDEVRQNWMGFFKLIGFLSVVAILLLLEPDLGSLVILTTATFGMFLMAGAKWQQFVAALILVSIALVLLAWLEPYRMARLVSYTDPWAHAYGSGYQLTQALIAFGRGGWLGEGLGNSIQKLFYLPEAHTDFVFAILAEELGLLGALVVITGFVFISWRAIQIAHRAEVKGLKYHAFLGYGLAILFACQCLMNLGVSSGLLPTKGLALPLISYGGSNLIINCLLIGILLRIDYERRLSKVVKEPVIAGRKRSKKHTGGVYG